MKVILLKLNMLFVMSLAAFTHSSAQSYGETLVADICPGTNPSTPVQFTEAGSKVFFQATDCIHGKEWWVTDGTAAGTRMIVDLRPGASGQTDVDAGVHTMLNGLLYFTASDSLHGVELWKTDGTAAGTTLVKDIEPGINRSYISTMYHYAGKIYFSKSKGNGGVAPNELWVTDGTTAGTKFVTDLDVLVYSMEYNGRLYVQASKPATRIELYSTDGTDTGTHIVKDISPGTGSGNPRLFTKLNGYLFFVAGIGNDIEMMRTDGTDTGTKIVKNIYNGGFGANPYYPVVFNNYLYFSCTDSVAGGFGIWKTDGTEAGTKRVAASPSTVNMFPWMGKLYMSGKFGTVGRELYSLDTNDQITFIKDLYPGTSSTNSDPAYFIPYDGKLFFTAQTSGSARTLFYTDGSDTGTKKAVAGVGGYLPTATSNFLAVVDSFLVYNGTTTATGLELYKLMDTTTPPTNIASNNTFEGIKVYPNPASTKLQLSTNIDLKPATAVIYNITGKAMIEANVSATQKVIDISSLPTGMYYLRLIGYTVPFLKQ